MRRALVTGYHAPQLDRDSGSRRIAQIIDLLLEQGWSLRFLAVDGIVDSFGARRLRRLGVPVYDGYVHSLEELLDGFQPDIALIAYWLNARRLIPRLRRASPSARIVIDTVDFHFLRTNRTAFDAWRATGVGGDEMSAMFSELDTYAAADALLTVSDAETDLLDELLKSNVPIFTVPDTESMPRSTTPVAERRGILCMGSFQHPPNRDAAAFLVHDIVPRLPVELLSEHPVLIVGNDMTDDVRRIGAGLANVRMVGWVPSVMPYLNRARITVVPLLSGAGTKRKLVQALSAGTPSVSTSIGIEGLGLVDGENVLVADTAEDFAQQIVRLMTDDGLWRRIADAGVDTVGTAHGLESVRRSLDAALMAVLQVEPRADTVVPFDPWRDGSLGPAMPISRTANLKLTLRRSVDRLPWFVRANPLFDPEWYVARYPDVRGFRLGAYAHYHQHGWREGRSPNPWFEPEWYLARNPDVAATGREPLDHYLRFGAREGRDPGPGFDAERYVRDNPDVGELGLNPLLHFMRHGRQEGRVAHQLTEALPVAVSLRPPAASIDVTNGRDGLASGQSEADIRTDVRVIAFYLPQFHPIPENDAWWGPGFTEWRNVAQARPLYQGHYQPQMPGELGFYDLRLPETRIEQANLARGAGIHGFCYYHYWFGGKQLLQRPFNEVLASGEPDFPFALCWANDPWSRRWDGREDQVLEPQRYSLDDDREHIRALLPAFTDPRAIRVDGKPMFLVYRARDLPNAERTVDLWRTEAARAGLPDLHLVAVETAWDVGWDATQHGFDAKVLFQPQFGLLERSTARMRVASKPDLLVYDYDQVRTLAEELPRVAYPRYESVFPSWDNTPRVGERGVVVSGSTPEAYGAWLKAAVERAATQPADQRIVFVNAWNEWAEGCHLEPDRRFGRAYLDATRMALAEPIRA